MAKATWQRDYTDTSSMRLQHQSATSCRETTSTSEAEQQPLDLIAHLGPGPRCIHSAAVAAAMPHPAATPEGES